MNFFKHFRSGQGLVEYSLIIALVAILVVTGLTILAQGRVPVVYNSASDFFATE